MSHDILLISDQVSAAEVVFALRPDDKQLPLQIERILIHQP
jgi:hypothetical protein